MVSQKRGLPGARRLAICAPMVRYEPEFLLFASDRTWGIIWGVAFVGLAGFALWRDRRRVARLL